jgi:peptide deformylase
MGANGPDIVQWPDARLSARCAPVGNADVSDLITAMFTAMYAAPGRGLAAPQIGVLKRVFVMDCGWKDGEMTPVVCIDPAILWSSEVTGPAQEGCLSIPDAPATVIRPLEVRLAWTGLDGGRQERLLTGFEARCAQHEYDHLDGRVIFDHLAPDDRARIEGAYLAARAGTPA